MGETILRRYVKACGFEFHYPHEKSTIDTVETVIRRAFLVGSAATERCPCDAPCAPWWRFSDRVGEMADEWQKRPLLEKSFQFLKPKCDGNDPKMAGSKIKQPAMILSREILMIFS